MKKSDLRAIITGENRSEPTAEITKFNSGGVEVLTDNEVISIGDTISARLSELGFPSLDSPQAIESDSYHAERVDRTTTASKITITNKKGQKYTIELREDSNIGKSGASTDMRTWIAYKFGLNVNSGTPDTIRNFVALATRYATLKTERDGFNPAICIEEMLRTLKFS